MHIPPYHESYLPELISRQGALPAEHPKSGTPIRPGRVYVAPPDHHLLVGDGIVQLGHGPKENRHRPAIDTMFRSAAQSYSGRVVGVLLTGNLDDGVAGLERIQHHGGLTVVQDPTEAPYPDMPLNALQVLQPDHCLTLNKIASLLNRLPPAPSANSHMKGKKHVKKSNPSLHTIGVEPQGQPVPLVCPECHGPLWEMRDGKLVRYQCLVGHHYSLASLLAAHAEELEAGLWVALRTLEERITLHRRLVEQTRGANQNHPQKLFQQRIAENTRHAKLLRKILERIAE